MQLYIHFPIALLYFFTIRWAELRSDFRAALHIALATMHLHYNLAYLTPIEPYPDHLTGLTRLRLAYINLPTFWFDICSAHLTLMAR